MDFLNVIILAGFGEDGFEGEDRSQKARPDPICTICIPFAPFAHLLFYPKNQNSYHLLDLTKGETA
ncbi:MAG: hypothetical protein Q8K51_01420 [Nitrospirota bacterium]|nr:hypothetical protein [Nitrospirota bacterium]